MKYFVIVHIHNCFASYSSGDISMQKVVSKIEFDILKKNAKEVYVSSKFKYSALWLEDNTYCNVRTPMYRATKEEMNDLVKLYKERGFSIDLNEYTFLQSQDSKYEDTKLAQKRKEEGYLSYTSYDWKYSRDQMQGGFSNELWNYEPIAKYTEKNCFGYFGHSIRKAELDEYFETVIKEITANAKVQIDWREIAYNWLSSTDARHFSDNLERNNFNAQKEKIDNYKHTIWNQAYIYGKSEHTGMYKDTISLLEKYKDDLYE